MEITKDRARAVKEARAAFGDVFADSVFRRVNYAIMDGKLTLRQVDDMSLLDFLELD